MNNTKELNAVDSVDEESTLSKDGYEQGQLGMIPELPEDFILIKGGYRSRDCDSINSPFNKVS
jgi:hypothetical protein